jgi:Flp pilus assembly protein TadD
MELTIEQALHQAIEAHRAGRLQQAERLYQAIILAQPRHPHANHNLGVLAVSLGQPAFALPLLRAALESDSTQGQFWISYVDALIKTDQLETASQVLDKGHATGLSGAVVEDLEQRLAAVGADLPARAVRHREAGEYGQAETLLKAWLADHADDAEAWSLLAQVSLLSRKEPRAREALERAAALAADLPSVRRNQARLLLRARRPAEALQAVQVGYELSPEDPETLLVMAACLTEVGRDGDATPLIEHALRSRPNWAEALGARGAVRLRQGDLEDAKRDAETAVSIKPHLVSSWALLAVIHHQLGDLGRVIEALERVHKLDPDNADASIKLGELLRQTGQNDRAIALLQRAASLAPQNGAAWSSLGAALLQAERVEEAKAALSRALTLDPQSAEAVNNLGAAAKADRDWEGALGYFQQAAAIRPGNSAFALNIGAALMELNRPGEAEAVFRQITALEPTNPAAHVSLGLLLSRGGAMDEATQSYRSALDLAPDDSEILLPAADHAMFRDDLRQASALYRRTLEVDPGNRGLKAGVNLAVLHFMQGNSDLASSLLDASREVLATFGSELRPYRIYWKFLHDLLTLQETKDGFPVGEADDSIPLYVIGESHALVSHNLRVTAGGTLKIGRCEWISGCKQWHLGGPGRNWHKHKFETVVSTLPLRSHLLLSIGEIDCRPDEGILAYGRKRPDIPQSRIVEATVAGYLDYVAAAVLPFGHHVTIQGVPCPDIRSRTLPEPENRKWAEVTAAVNAALDVGSLSSGFGFVNLGALTDRGDGISNETWHMDGVHLRPDAMQEAWRTYYRPGAAHHSL